MNNWRVGGHSDVFMGGCVLCVILPPKHENIFMGALSQKAHFFLYRRLWGTYGELALKFQREQTTGIRTPPFCFRSVMRYNYKHNLETN